MKRTYTELISLPTFEERFRYLKMNGSVGDITFGHERFLNQALYASYEWKRVRREVLIRDNCCDLAIEDRLIYGPYPIIHHINPITRDDILERRNIVFDLENLITTTYRTHNAIHYGDESQIALPQLVERRPGDTCPWK